MSVYTRMRVKRDSVAEEKRESAKPLKVKMYKQLTSIMNQFFPHDDSYSLPRGPVVPSEPVPVREPSVCEPELGVWRQWRLRGPLWRTAQLMLWESFCLLCMAKSCGKFVFVFSLYFIVTIIHAFNHITAPILILTNALSLRIDKIFRGFPCE